MNNGLPTFIECTSSRHTVDSNSCPPDPELGTLTNWLASQMLVWVSSCISPSSTALVLHFCNSVAGDAGTIGTVGVCSASSLYCVNPELLFNLFIFLFSPIFGRYQAAFTDKVQAFFYLFRAYILKKASAKWLFYNWCWGLFSKRKLIF